MRGFNAAVLGGALCLLVMGVIILRTLFSSAFFVKQDRINILLYGAAPIYYSFEKGGEVHYITTFNAESRTAVPGGYGIYRIGAIGKLVSLEKNPDLLKKTFSRITGSMIDYYFYPRGEAIYYGGGEKLKLASFTDIFFSDSHANFFDRIYIYLQFTGKHITDFEEIHIDKVKTGDSVLLSDVEFARQYLGYFYHKSLRSENKTVQILYSDSYIAAKNMSRIIDGEGMRVVDIDMSRKLKVSTKGRSPSGRESQKSACEVVENTKGGYSLTARKLSEFFHCILKVGKGRVSDIVIEMGRAEKEWE